MILFICTDFFWKIRIHFRRQSRKHAVQHFSQSINILLPGIYKTLCVRKKFRRHKTRSTCDTYFAAVTGDKTGIAQFWRTFDEKNIIWFDIPMDKMIFMENCNSSYEDLHVSDNIFWRKTFSTIQPLL